MKTSFATVLKNKDFLKIWGAQLVSLICANMLVFILMGRIYQNTGSTIAVGLLWGFDILPSAILGPFIGVFLDYLDKKKILIFSSLIQANIKKNTQIFVAEMGAYKKGEIKKLTDIVRPKIGIITGIAPQHLELFGSLKNIMEAKYELIEALPEEGPCFSMSGNIDNKMKKIAKRNH